MTTMANTEKVGMMVIKRVNPNKNQLERAVEDSSRDQAIRDLNK